MLCDKCDFATNSEAGLKSHTSKEHMKGKENAEIVFPQQSTLCDEILKNNKENKIHMRLLQEHMGKLLSVVFVTMNYIILKLWTFILKHVILINVGFVKKKYCRCLTSRCTLKINIIHAEILIQKTNSNQ